MNDLQLEIRPARLPGDYPAISEIITATDPDFALTSKTLEQDDRTLDPALNFTRFIAEDSSGRAIGTASIGHDRWNPHEGVWIVRIFVLPEFQRRGVGKMLYQTILNYLEPSPLRELKAQAREDNHAAIAFLQQHGFREVWRRFQSTLETANFDFAPYDGLEKKLEGNGIRIVTYPELETDPEHDRKLFELDMELFEDIPMGEALVKPSFERWKADQLEPERVLKEAYFVAVQDGVYVGQSTLWTDGPRLLTAMTGVRRSHRGVGLALALKLCGIRYAKDHGDKEIMTMNDAPNTAMIGINEKLGFQRAPEWIRYARVFEENA
jgi:RimJ/RimL family protein N-acetyltransferase